MTHRSLSIKGSESKMVNFRQTDLDNYFQQIVRSFVNSRSLSHDCRKRANLVNYLKLRKRECVDIKRSALATGVDTRAFHFQNAKSPKLHPAGDNFNFKVLENEKTNKQRFCGF